MLNDISTIDAMIRETLAYLRDGGSSEATALVDLPSLLQTICGEFNDIGHEVHYSGPSRFAFACQSRSLTRAVTNIVENGVKHGSSVTVALGPAESADAHIDISDDGPGIPPELLEKVFEPFFKADPARSPLGSPGIRPWLVDCARHHRTTRRLNHSTERISARVDGSHDAQRTSTAPRAKRVIRGRKGSRSRRGAFAGSYPALIALSFRSRPRPATLVHRQNRGMTKVGPRLYHDRAVPQKTSLNIT